MSKGRRARRRARAERTRPLPQRVATAPNRPDAEPYEPLPASMIPAAWALPQRPAPPPEEPDPVATQPLPAELSYPRQVTVEELTGGRDDTALTADLAAKLREIPSCQHCGGRHARACPRVRRLSFHPDGKLASVEFWPSGKWSDDDIIWPEDLDAE